MSDDPCQEINPGDLVYISPIFIAKFDDAVLVSLEGISVNNYHRSKTKNYTCPMPRNQHDSQIDQQPSCSVLWMSHDCVYTAIYKDCCLNVAFSFRNTTLFAERNERQHAKNPRNPQTDPSCRLELFKCVIVQEES